MNKKSASVIFFLLWTFAISYGLWAICIFGQRVGWFPSGSNWFMPFYIVGGNAPPIAAYLTLKRSDPDFTFKKFLKFTFDVKQKPLYYALTFLTVAIFFIVPAITGNLETGAAPGLENQGISGQVPLYLTLLAIPVFFFGGGSEEIGWRGILQPELEKKMPFLPSTLITAVIWTLWHLPLWWINGTGQAEVNFWFFLITVIGFSFGYAAVRRVSGSLFLCVLMHCAWNSLQGTWPVKYDLMTRSSIAIAFVLFSVIVVYIHKKVLQHKDT
ncbi:MAG: CPBP family intramembrane metalloprotease [Oscillospiraceae bacterium]|nr:CPBP family intramembrane metalloprotease [Oscillospiraceae bacterium]